MRNLVSPFLPVALAALFAAGCATTEPAAQPAPAPAAEVKPAAPAPAPAAAAAAPAASSMMSYNVVRGDHLWGISSKSTIYGNPYQWPLIFKANRGKIQDADLIEPGWVLSVDKNPTSADVNAAVRHAKTRGEWSIGTTEQSDISYLASYAMK